MTGVALALLSALVWGAADFVGGVASRRADALQVLLVSATAGVILLGVAALLTGEPSPDGQDIGWAAAAGIAGAIGIASLYRGLAVGRAAIVAPTAGVLSAAVPMLFSAVAVAAPASRQVAGFALALVGIWLVASAPDEQGRGRAGFGLAIVAGLGFGAFLVLIAQVPDALVFGPLVVARLLTLATALLLVTSRRLPAPPVRGHPLAVLAGVLDAGGNVCYLLARQHVRVDVAAVLSSFYPAATVLLAWALLRERVSVGQWIGAAVCLAAVGLITG